MQKTKLAFVSLLSLLVVLTPVSTALAKAGVRESSNQNVKKEVQKNNSRSSVFQRIEKQGGDGVSEERLDKVKGEFGPIGWAGVGALSGAASYGIKVGLTDKNFSWGGLGTSMVAGGVSSVTGYGVSALTTASEAVAAAGTVIGSAIGSTVSSLSPWS